MLTNAPKSLIYNNNAIFLIQITCISDLKKLCDPCWPSSLHLEHYQSLWQEKKSKVNLDLTVKVSPQKPHSLIRFTLSWTNQAYVCASVPQSSDVQFFPSEDHQQDRHQIWVNGNIIDHPGYVVAWLICADMCWCQGWGLKEQSLSWKMVRK